MPRWLSSILGLLILNHQFLVETEAIIPLPGQTVSSSTATRNSIPKPQDAACHVPPNTQHICNVDQVLTDGEVEFLESMMEDSFLQPDNIMFECGSLSSDVSNSNNSTETTPTLPIGIFLEAYPHSKDYKDAKTIAYEMQNEWNLIVPGVCGQRSIFVYVCIQAHELFILRGIGLRRQLTKDVLQDIAEVAQPFLDRHMYASALETILAQISLHLLLPEPSEESNNSTSPNRHFVRIHVNQETMHFWMIVVVILVCLLCFAFHAADVTLEESEKRTQIQNEIKELLSEVDDVHFMAQTTQSYMALSCPICLEAYPGFRLHQHDMLQKKKQQHHRVNSQETTPLMRNRKRVGTDGQPLLLLPCGHVFDETCLMEELDKNNNNDNNKMIGATTRSRSTKSPFQKRSASETCLTDEPEIQKEITAIREGSFPNRNQHNNHKKTCPICHKGIPNNFFTDMSMMARLRRESVSERITNNFLTGSAFDKKMYQLERQYRLKRIQQRYPDWISRDMLQEWIDWSETNSNGETLSLWNDFLKRHGQ